MGLVSTEAIEIEVFLSHEKIEKTDQNGKDIDLSIQADQDIDRSIPTDRGWAWLILAGAVLTMTIIIGCRRTTGILFLEFQEKFRSSSAETSLISTVMSVTFCLVAPVVMTIGLKVTSSSVMVLVGGVLMFSSFVITTFAHDLRIVIVTQGVLVGTSMACTEAPTVSMVTKYFEKRRGFANSVTSAGGSLGGLVIPPLVTFLLEQYGYKGGLRLIGAITLNICISAALFNYQKSRLYKQKFRAQEFSKNTKSKKEKSIFKDLVEMFDFKLFRKPLFLLFQLSFGLLTAANFMCIFFIAPYADEIGIGSGGVASLVTIFSATDMCSRFIIGVISDFEFVRRSTILGICALVLGITMNFARYYRTFGLLVVHVLVSGMTGGSVMTLYPTIIVDYLSVKQLDSTLGFAMLSMGSSCGIFLYIGGCLRDMTGSYVATMHFVGALALLGGFIMFSLPFMEKWKKSQQQRH